MVAPHLRTGSRGESAAEKFLRQKGYHILARNWRAGAKAETHAGHGKNFFGKYAGKLLGSDKDHRTAMSSCGGTTARSRRETNLELDLICRHGDTLVFVEVKTRSAGGMQRPDQALTKTKRTRLIRAAEHYLSSTGNWNTPCRFDLVAVQLHGDTYTVTHYEHAFDISESVGSSHSAWQPW